MPASSATAPCVAPSCPPGGRLGIYGFGASAHLTAQIALAEGARSTCSRGRHRHKRSPWSSASSSAAGADDSPPEPLDAAILFAPVGDLVPGCLRALDRGGTLAVAGIYLSDIPALHYGTDLFQERTLRSVTANTRTTASSSSRPPPASASG